jgi:hypothetical protein
MVYHMYITKQVVGIKSHLRCRSQVGCIPEMDSDFRLDPPVKYRTTHPVGVWCYHIHRQFESIKGWEMRVGPEEKC